MTRDPDHIDYHSLLAAAVEAGSPQERIDELLAMCPDGECEICAICVCPHEDELHFHHDGCPSCAEVEDMRKH